jgi:hypothetical protein
MVGARPQPEELLYPVSEVARKHNAGVEQEATSGPEAYAAYSMPDQGLYRDGLLP